jgi:hypothetical protein
MSLNGSGWYGAISLLLFVLLIAPPFSSSSSSLHTPNTRFQSSPAAVPWSDIYFDVTLNGSGIPCGRVDNGQDPCYDIRLVLHQIANNTAPTTNDTTRSQTVSNYIIRVQPGLYHLRTGALPLMLQENITIVNTASLARVHNGATINIDDDDDDDDDDRVILDLSLIPHGMLHSTLSLIDIFPLCVLQV